MPFANPAQLDPNEDDVLACVDAMRPGLQRVIDQCSRGEALVCAMTLTYAGLIHARGGAEEPLTKGMAALAGLPRTARKEAQRCHEQIKQIIVKTQERGFSPDAILWSLIGAITSIFASLGHSKAEVDQCVGDMITQLNYARRLSVN
jgi:hypothetical protein